MTNRIALVLASLIVVALSADHAWNDSLASYFLLRKFLDLTDWIAFWH